MRDAKGGDHSKAWRGCRALTCNTVVVAKLGERGLNVLDDGPSLCPRRCSGVLGKHQTRIAKNGSSACGHAQQIYPHSGERPGRSGIVNVGYGMQSGRGASGRTTASVFTTTTCRSNVERYGNTAGAPSPCSQVDRARVPSRGQVCRIHGNRHRSGSRAGSRTFGEPRATGGCSRVCQ
jgi:hypothetical protein